MDKISWSAPKRPVSTESIECFTVQQVSKKNTRSPKKKHFKMLDKFNDLISQLLQTGRGKNTPECCIKRRRTGDRGRTRDRGRTVHSGGHRGSEELTGSEERKQGSS